VVALAWQALQSDAPELPLEPLPVPICGNTVSLRYTRLSFG
jgi:hypothetical protein